MYAPSATAAADEAPKMTLQNFVKKYIEQILIF